MTTSKPVFSTQWSNETGGAMTKTVDQTAPHKTEASENLMTSDTASAEQSTKTVKLIYFAWVRERIGQGEEMVALPAGLKTVGDLMAWLAGRGPEYAEVFEGKKDVIRAALNQTHVKSDTLLGEANEIAFFPPVTGG